MVFNVFAD